MTSRHSAGKETSDTYEWRLERLGGQVVSVRLRNYKCFDESGAGFEKILPPNLIIGRNNSGKSSLLELVEYLVRPFDLSRFAHKGHVPQVELTTNLQEDSLRQHFSETTSGGAIGGNHWTFGRDWLAKPITWLLDAKGQGHLVKVDPPLENRRGLAEFEALAGNLHSPFAGLSFKRLRSDRDVSAEADGHGHDVAPNGEGATTLIKDFLTNAGLPTTVVEDRLLEELNKIFQPDVTFGGIKVQQLQDRSWEVYLREHAKGDIALSQSGSGLKTVLLVLTYLHLIPAIEAKGLESYVFGFEELENNLHPALLRRLFLYLRSTALESGCVIFVTTHSNVVIDLFGDDEAAQIVHVQHDGTSATAAPVLAYVQRRGILDDLDIRASDLLQSNGVVWVEGPCDRLYFKRWIELWTGSRLREGAHYQCVFYGGRLLSHLSADDPEIDIDDLIRILKVNRNSAILIDSDRPRKGAHLNATKRRLVSEIEKLDGYAWVSSGREVENYIPPEALQHFLQLPSPPVLDQYLEFDKTLDNLKPAEGKNYLRNKVRYAAEVCPFLTRDAIATWLDLAAPLDLAEARILAWNGMRAR